MKNKSKETAPYQRKIEKIIQEKFLAQHHMSTFLIDAMVWVCYYHRERKGAKDAACVIGVLSNEILQPWMRQTEGSHIKTGVKFEDEGIPGLLDESLMNKAGIYILKAFSDGSRDGSYSEEYQNKIIDQIDVFFQIADILKERKDKHISSLLKQASCK